MLCAHSVSENIKLCNGPYFHFAAGVKDVGIGPGIEKRLAETQLKLAQGSGTSGPSKAAELQALHMEDKADVLPAENGAENLIQFVQREGVGHRDDADDHRTHVAKNSSK